MDRWGVVAELETLQLMVGETYQSVSAHRSSLGGGESTEVDDEGNPVQPEGGDEEEVDQDEYTDADRTAVRNMFAFVDEVKQRLADAL